jgi:hypothetical protein
MKFINVVDNFDIDLLTEKYPQTQEIIRSCDLDKIYLKHCGNINIGTPYERGCICICYVFNISAHRKSVEWHEYYKDERKVRKKFAELVNALCQTTANDIPVHNNTTMLNYDKLLEAEFAKEMEETE